MKKGKIYIILSLIILAVLCLKGLNFTGNTIVDLKISQDEALFIAQDFVNGYVKFYVKEDYEKGNVVKYASINITDIYHKNNEWHIEVYVSSGEENDRKKAGLVVVIDSNTGYVKKDKLRQFRLRE